MRPRYQRITVLMASIEDSFEKEPDDRPDCWCPSRPLPSGRHEPLGEKRFRSDGLASALASFGMTPAETAPTGPENLHVVRSKLRIRGQHSESLDLRLCDQNPVERVPVMQRHSLQMKRVALVDRKRDHALG